MGFLFVCISDSTKDLFYLMDTRQIQSDQNYSLPYQQFWVFRQKYSAEEALLWCLTRKTSQDCCFVGNNKSLISFNRSYNIDE